MTEQVPSWQALAILATIGATACLIAAFAEQAWRTLKGALPWRRRPPAAPFDLARARRESHALGFPFPEADGSLSMAQPQHAELRPADDNPLAILQRYGVSLSQEQQRAGLTPFDAVVRQLAAQCGVTTDEALRSIQALRSLPSGGTVRPNREQGDGNAADQQPQGQGRASQARRPHGHQGHPRRSSAG